MITSKGTDDLREYEIPIGAQFKLNAKKKLGSGSFGEIYYGINLKRQKEVAIKLEPIKSKHPQLLYESKLYMQLQGGEGIPQLYWHGSQGTYNIMVIDLLGPSIEDLFSYCHRKFTLKTILMLADQMISRIEFVHSRNLIHRDIKPDNFLIGKKEEKGIIYLIDFGLAKKYRDSRLQHIPYRDGKSLTGTARYASINTHLGIEQSRRDDMESLGYILVYLAKGELPWQGLKAKTIEEKYKKIMEKKISIKVEDLTKGLPQEFEIFISYTRELSFSDCPDYLIYHRLISQIREREKISFDEMFDWVLKYYTDKNKLAGKIQENDQKNCEKFHEVNQNSSNYFMKPYNVPMHIVSNSEGNNIAIQNKINNSSKLVNQSINEEYT